MSSKNDLTLISNIYSATLNEAAKNTTPRDTFKVATDKKPKEAKASDKAFVKGTGPENASGFDKNIIDPKTMSKGKMKKNLHEPANFSQKNESKEINNYMSKKFDDLFKDVINDKLRLEDSDIEAVEDIAAMPELEGGDDTLDAEADDDFESDMSPTDMLDQIQGLLDDLRAKIGDEEVVDDLGDGEGFEDDDASLEEDEEEGAACGTGAPTMEDTEMKEVKNSEGEKLMNKNNKVGGVAGKVAGGKAQNVGDYKVGYNDGEAKESDLHNGKKQVVQSTVKAGRQIGH